MPQETTASTSSPGSGRAASATSKVPAGSASLAGLTMASDWSMPPDGRRAEQGQGVRHSAALRPGGGTGPERSRARRHGAGPRRSCRTTAAGGRRSLVEVLRERPVASEEEVRERGHLEQGGHGRSHRSQRRVVVEAAEHRPGDGTGAEGLSGAPAQEARNPVGQVGHGSPGAAQAQRIRGKRPSAPFQAMFVTARVVSNVYSMMAVGMPGSSGAPPCGGDAE